MIGNKIIFIYINKRYKTKYDLIIILYFISLLYNLNKMKIIINYVYSI